MGVADNGYDGHKSNYPLATVYYFCRWLDKRLGNADAGSQKARKVRDRVVKRLGVTMDRQNYWEMRRSIDTFLDRL